MPEQYCVIAFASSRQGFMLIGGVFGTDILQVAWFPQDKAEAMAKKFNANAGAVQYLAVSRNTFDRVQP